MGKAEIRMDISEWQELQQRVEASEKQLIDAKRLVDEMRLGNADESARILLTALERSLEIVRFAVANLDPLSVRGWPHEALMKLASSLPSLPGLDDANKESSVDLQLFARVAGEWEEAREKGIERERFAEITAAKGIDLEQFLEQYS